MKKFFAVIVFLSVGSFMFSQSPLPKGTGQFNGGVGFSDWGVPVYLGLDFGVHNDISIGPEVSFRNYDENWKDRNYHHQVVGFLFNGNYHFNTVLNIPSNWDFYAGLNLGFYVWNSSEDYAGTQRSGLGLGAQVGGRYYFTRNFGVNLEFGGGNAFSGGKFGVSLKF